jgi:hypothetical protein
LEALVTPEMRRFALKSLFPTLAQEVQRLTGSGPRFECYTTDDGADRRVVVVRWLTDHF